MSKNFKSDYFKSEDHLENCRKAGIKGNKRIKELQKERIQKYNENPKKCKLCGKPFDYFHKLKIFCNTSCAATFNNTGRVVSEETRNKIAKSNEGFTTKNGYKESIPLITKICSCCKKEYQTRKTKQIYCSRLCARKMNGTSLESREKIRQKQLQHVKDGTHKGWKLRSNKTPSYPEQYFIDLLNNENIGGWEREYKCGSFFIDFAFLDKKIAVEIDGKQHNYKDRKERDIIKNDFLIEDGWKIIRIKWFNPVNNENKEKLYSQLNEFKYYINSNQ
jgi:very-short-patch-repair endonuclease